MSRVLSPREIWGMPALLGVLSLVGLVAALVADGAGDALSWVALTVPVLACLPAVRRSRPPAAPAPADPPRRSVRPVRLPPRP